MRRGFAIKELGEVSMTSTVSWEALWGVFLLLKKLQKLLCHLHCFEKLYRAWSYY